MKENNFKPMSVDALKEQAMAYSNSILIEYEKLLTEYNKLKEIVQNITDLMKPVNTEISYDKQKKKTKKENNKVEEMPDEKSNIINFFNTYVIDSSDSKVDLMKFYYKYNFVFLSKPSCKSIDEFAKLIMDNLKEINESRNPDNKAIYINYHADDDQKLYIYNCECINSKNTCDDKIDSHDEVKDNIFISSKNRYINTGKRNRHKKNVEITDPEDLEMIKDLYKEYNYRKVYEILIDKFGYEKYSLEHIKNACKNSGVRKISKKCYLTDECFEFIKDFIKTGDKSLKDIAVAINYNNSLGSLYSTLCNNGIRISDIKESNNINNIKDFFNKNNIKILDKNDPNYGNPNIRLSYLYKKYINSYNSISYTAFMNNLEKSSIDISKYGKYLYTTNLIELDNHDNL